MAPPSQAWLPFRPHAAFLNAGSLPAYPLPGAALAYSAAPAGLCVRVTRKRGLVRGGCGAWLGAWNSFLQLLGTGSQGMLRFPGTHSGLTVGTFHPIRNGICNEMTLALGNAGPAAGYCVSSPTSSSELPLRGPRSGPFCSVRQVPAKSRCLTGICSGSRPCLMLVRVARPGQALLASPGIPPRQQEAAVPSPATWLQCPLLPVPSAQARLPADPHTPAGFLCAASCGTHASWPRLRRPCVWEQSRCSVKRALRLDLATYPVPYPLPGRADVGFDYTPEPQRTYSQPPGLCAALFLLFVFLILI